MCLLCSFLSGIYSVGCQLNLATGVTRESICTDEVHWLIKAIFIFWSINILQRFLYFCHKGAKNFTFFLCFPSFLNLIPIEEWMNKLIWKFPFSKQQTGPLPFSFPLHGVSFNYITLIFLILLSALQTQVCSIENMFKACVYISCSLWPTLGAWAMENEML